MEKNFIESIKEVAKQDEELISNCEEKITLFNSMNITTQRDAGKQFLVEREVLVKTLDVVATLHCEMEDKIEELEIENNLYKEKFGELQKDELVKLTSLKTVKTENKHMRLIKSVNNLISRTRKDIK